MNTTRYERRRYAVVRASVCTSSWRIAAASARRSSVVCKGSPCRGRGSRIVPWHALLVAACRAANLRRAADTPSTVDRHTAERNRSRAQLEVGVLDRLAARADEVRADRLVAELARDAERLRVAVDRAGARAVASPARRSVASAPPRASRCRARGPATPRRATSRWRPTSRADARSSAWTPIGAPSRKATNRIAVRPCCPVHVVTRKSASSSASVHGISNGMNARIVDAGLGDLDTSRRSSATGRQGAARGAASAAAGASAGAGAACRNVTPADEVEAELRVELPRPVVGERLEEHEIVRARASSSACWTIARPSPRPRNASSVSTSSICARRRARLSSQ